MSAVHHMPGRLRLKSSKLKNCPDLANAAMKPIFRLDGVKFVRVNVITGSLLIHYEAHGARQHVLLTAIDDINRELGLERETPMLNFATAPSASANPLVDRFLDRVIEKALERSALPLLGALL